MARNRQLYEDVMDVALRATLKEFGFKRKSYATYIMDRPERRWIYELWSEPRIGAGFNETAAVGFPAIEAIIKRYLQGIFVAGVGTRTKAFVGTITPQLMEIAEGHDFYTLRGGPASRRRSKKYQAAQNDPIMKYQRDGWWALPKHPMIGKPGFDEDEFDRIIWDNVAKLGRFLDEQWRAHMPAWYRSCDDPLFVADWIENRQFFLKAVSSDFTLAILYHQGGDDERAARYLHRRIEEGRLTYNETYSELRKEHGGSWLRQLLYPGCWSEEKVAEGAASTLKWRREYAEAARRLADGLGISL